MCQAIDDRLDILKLFVKRLHRFIHQADLLFQRRKPVEHHRVIAFVLDLFREPRLDLVDALHQLRELDHELAGHAALRLRFSPKCLCA